MAYLSDIEIAQACEMKNIREIAATAISPALVKSSGGEYTELIQL